ncbi:hypothetical protein O181_022935 [Austropuccinia psidii MF-1]|uniref:Uncharacterized protein n=1 Tax=Austropuccinia psidii MF-1 TaxID=1389203 RepID=A0A9Q3GYL3_9BASI|nr:hypothetical protein [Austropuccinia psidii MF-1]
MNLPTPSTMGYNRKPPAMACMKQFVLTHQIFQELVQWGMADRELNLEFHYKELVESTKKKFPQRDILQRAYHRQEMEPEITYSDTLRLMRTGKPTRLPSGFTPLSHQQISDQKSPFFLMSYRIQ